MTVIINNFIISVQILLKERYLPLVKTRQLEKYIYNTVQ